MTDKGNQAILAILREAKDIDQRLTRTALTKFLYLLDVLYAEETGGKTWTSWVWKFHYFGPWSGQAMGAIDALVSKSFVEVEEGSSKRGNKDYVLYALASWKTTQSLEQLGIPSNARLRLVQLIKDYAGNLSGLLNFVYFHTEPMAEARPEQALDFAHCTKIQFASIKPLQMRPIEKKAAEAFREKLRATISEKKKQTESFPWEGLYDEIYYKGLAELEGNPLPVGISGKAKINI